MSKLSIHELTLRDGIMARPPVSTNHKVTLFRRLLQAGISNFEVARFPIDGKYPQFNDALELLEKLRSYSDGATIAVFAMGKAGIDEALKVSHLFHELHVPCFVSDRYSQYAFGTSDWESCLRIVEQAHNLCRRASVKLTVGLGTSFGCPIARDHNLDKMLARFRQLTDLGVHSIMLGDTAGTATPDLIRKTFDGISSIGRPSVLRVHFHNTFGRALLNSWFAHSLGADGIDTSLMGLGGEAHPYFTSPTKVDNGNCATEEVFSTLLGQHGNDAVLGIVAATTQIGNILDTCRWFADILNEDPFGRSGFAELIPIEEPNANEISRAANRH